MVKRSEQGVYEFDRFRLDAASAMLYENGEAISLPPRAVETLLALVERSGEIIPKDRLMSVIWADSIVEESNLSQYIHLLRKTLGKTKAGKPFIETLKRRGYRFNGDVIETENSVDTPAPSEFFDLSVKHAEPAVSRHGRTRVERRGNVLALAEWAAIDLPEPVKESPSADRSEGRGRGRSLLVAGIAVGAVLIGIGAILWLRSGFGADARRATSDLTFLNLTSGEDVDFATISPDGRYFAYSSRDGDVVHLWLQQTGQSNRTEILVPFTGAIHGTTFTPDSKSIYLIATEGAETRASLYRVPALGGVRTRIMTEVDSSVSFSPDGGQMVFARWDKEAGRSSLVVAPIDGSSERTLLAESNGTAIGGGAAWSPDGRMIAYGAVDFSRTEGACEIKGIDPLTGAIKILSPEKWDGCFRMAWTRDGRGLAFIGTRANESYSTRRDQLYFLSIHEGQSRRLTVDGNRHQFSSLGITDADEILAVPFSRFSQIWTLDATGDSRTAVQTTTGFADGRGGIAPIAHQRLAFLTRNGDGFSVWLMNADGSNRRQLTTDPPAIEELRAASDGSFFVFAARLSDRPHLYRVDADGGNLTQLTFGEGQELDSAVSPDGNWIVYDSTIFDGNYGKTSVWKIPSTGGEPFRLADKDCRIPHFSPDGRFVSCITSDRGSVSILNAENGETIRSMRTAANSVLNVGARWTPDGKALSYIVKHNNAGNVWLQPVDGGDPRPLTDFTSGDIYNFAFSVDATQLYVARGYPTRNAVLIKGFK